MRHKIIKPLITCLLLSMLQNTGFSQEATPYSRINEQFKRLGVDEEGLNNLNHILIENGISEEKIEKAKRGILGAVREVPEIGNEFILSERIQNYLSNDLSLSDEQIKIIKALASRISYQKKGTEQKQTGINERFISLGLNNEGITKMEAELIAIQIPKEKIEKVKRGILGCYRETPKEEEEFILSERIKNYLTVDLNLTSAQIDLVKTIAMRISKNVK